MIQLPDSLPWLVPGMALSLVLGTLLAAPVARRLGSRTYVSWMLLVSTGVILSATLTPVQCACPTPEAAGARGCDLARVGLASLADLASGNDIVENILMFIPLGFAIALVPASRRRTVLLIAALALPIAIESIQLVATPLARACQAWDVADNLTGLVIGLAAGALVGRLVPAARAGAGKQAVHG